MPKQASRSKTAAQPEWKTKWPRNGDLKAWFRAMIEKCDAIEEDDEAADAAHLPIEELAEQGCDKEALRHVNRFLRRLPREEVIATVRMAEAGAKICLASGDLVGAEKYLAIAEATEPFNTRKCDKGFSLNSVREFRADNGLLDPAKAIDDEQRVTARFEGAARRFQMAIAKRHKKSARAAVDEMEQVARDVDKQWRRQHYLRRVIACYGELKDAQQVKRCLRGLKAEDRHKILDARTLLELGMKAQAIARARQDIAGELEELSERGDPNIHFPMMAITRSLKFLSSKAPEPRPGAGCAVSSRRRPTGRCSNWAGALPLCITRWPRPRRRSMARPLPSSCCNMRWPTPRKKVAAAFAKELSMRPST